MPGFETLCICDMPSVYDEGAPPRGEATPHTSASSGSAWLLQDWKYHKQFKDRQGEMVQYVNIQNALYPWLPRCNPETWDNGLIQYTDGTSSQAQYWNYNWLLQSELAHCLSKLWYKLSNKNRGFIRQITDKESCMRFYTKLLGGLTEAHIPSTSKVTQPEPDLDEGEDGQDKLNDCYWMSKRAALTRNLMEWLAENGADHALKASLGSIDVVQC